MILCIGAAFVIPFCYHPLTMDPVLPLRFVVWTILTAVLLVYIACNSKKKYQPDTPALLYRKVFLFLAGIILVSLVSLSKAVNIPEAVFEMQKQLVFFCFVYATAMIAVSDRLFIDRVTRAMILSGLVLSCIGILAFFHNPFYKIMANKNLFASALFLISPFILFGIVRFSRGWKNLGILAGCGILLAVFLSGTRAVWLAACLSGMVYFIIFRPFRIYSPSDAVSGSRDLRRWLMMITGLVFVTAFLLIAAGIPGPFFDIRSTGTIEKRFELWKNTLKIIKSHPITGIGPGQWRIVYPCYGKQEPIQTVDGRSEKTVFQRPHNDYLGIASEYGSAGLMVHAGCIVMIVYYMTRILFRSNDKTEKALVKLLACGLSGYLVISFFSFPKERIYHLVVLAMITGIIISIYHQAFAVRIKRPFFPFWTIHTTLAVIMVLFAATGYSRMNSEIHAKKMVQAIHSCQWNEAVKHSKSAISPFYTMDIISNPIAWYQGLAYSNLNQSGNTGASFKAALKAHPCHAHAYNDLGIYFFNKNKYASALVCFQKAAAIDPGFTRALDNIFIMNQILP